MSKKITVEDILNCDYSQFVSIIDERNRCSGGIKTIHTIVNAIKLNKNDKILEIGSNTGFSSVNLAYLTGCKVQGIDVNQRSVNHAKKYAKESGVSALVKFNCGNGLNINFPDERFSLIWASNVTSFISEKQAALKEYNRVLKFNGYFSIVPIYYKKIPPQSLLIKVEDAIKTKLTIQSLDEWKKIISLSNIKQSALELIFEKKHNYYDAEKFIDSYLKNLISKSAIANNSPNMQAALFERGKYFYALFNENLKYCEYCILIFQKRTKKDESELF